MTGLVIIAVAEELPQCLSTEMSGSVELLRKCPHFFLVFKEENVEEHIFWRCWIDWKPAEDINMGLGLPRPMFNCKVVLFQRCLPAVEECRPCPHCLKPLQGIMVGAYLEWHGHEVWTELSNGPHNGETFQFCSGVGLFSLVERYRSAADDALPAFADLCQDRAKACG